MHTNSKLQHDYSQKKYLYGKRTVLSSQFKKNKIIIIVIINNAH